MKVFIRAVLVLAVLVVPAGAAEPQPPADVRFSRDVRPILANRCFKCHGPDLKKAGLALHTSDSATKLLPSGGKAVVPGNAADSLLVRRITETDPNERMPQKGDALTPVEVAVLKAWIERGAKYDEHWSLVRPTRQPLPAVKDRTWPRNGIDYFVLARLEKEGLTPAPEADRATLLRRASLDLTGLPPTIRELDDFLADTAPGAYERAVDKLLASPHYGEHQARFWLDEARYADTNGYEKDERRTIWPYRDWVIRAFNRDLPFDQFTIEQLAGDLLPNPTTEQLVATGFHRNTMVNTEGGTDDEEFRVAALVDRVNTTAEVWLGLTLNCCQCHNHKYDPFSQKEYYQLLAFFNSTADRGRSNEPILPLPSADEVARTEALRGEVTKLQKAVNAAGLGLGPLAVPRVSARIAELQKQLAALKPATTTLVMKELPQPRPTHVMIRGNHKNLGEPVSPRVPARLHGMPPDAPPNRLGLAQWLVAPENPLAARVTMNRVWARHFGRGFVETSEDFGIQGDLPTHPELLDWLALTFRDRGWSMKAMHKLIVTSATYRQSSVNVSRNVYERDPYNRLFARGPRLRLDAEVVRDNALAISGLLSRKLGGPSVFPYQPEGIWFNPYSGDRWVTSTGGDQHRRGLYTFWRRTAPYAAFMAFDAPSREVACERRPRTNTPLQALATLNDKVCVEASAALARRMATEASGERERIVHGFRLCVARMPTEREVELLRKLFTENVEKYRKDPVAAVAMVKNGAAARGVEASELAAWTVVANVLLNMDETITKE
jgi:hypothetical protein